MTTRKRPQLLLPTKKSCLKSLNLKVWKTKTPSLHPEGVIIHPIRQRIRIFRCKHFLKIEFFREKSEKRFF